MKPEELYNELLKSDLLNLQFQGVHKVGNFDIDLDKRKINVPEPIKTFGKYELDVKYYPDVTGKIYLIVTEKE